MRRNAQKEWTNYSRHLKKQRKHRRTIIKHQLQYVKRDLRYVEELLAQGGTLSDRQTQRPETIQRVYVQQRYMFENQTHHVEDGLSVLTSRSFGRLNGEKTRIQPSLAPKLICL
ncbi:hypothetical protein CHT97_10490 [Lacticaseibacillus chiayiensis]|nr:hypothetical protein [Lacticaseibacillus chiayiensis]RXT56875.1 hypothetical protein CHT97_10490 [Lacticaseibacillus chiayiensis]